MKKKEIIIISIVVIICIFSSAITTYFFVEQTNKNKIEALRVKYKEEQSDLNNQIQNLTNQIILFRNLDTKQHNYIKQIVKGLEEMYTAGKNVGAAEGYYDEASSSYENNDFYWCNIYAGYADTYYAYASQNYRDAKAFFNRALEYATSNSTKQLAQLFLNLSELEAQISSEMHEANEYFASACHYYYTGDYDMGDNEIDKMNEHIKTHDKLVPKENDLWSSIDALLENFSEAIGVYEVLE